MATNDNNILEILLKDIDKNINIDLENNRTLEWGKSLKNVPLFTIKEIEIHRENSGKTAGTAIIKTLERGRKSKEERYISADSITTLITEKEFLIKGKCKASMKKEFRSMEVRLDRNTSFVSSANCNCPAGNSGYCNHIMALLFELADYSLHQLDCVPDEIACTSKNRQWGIPSQTHTFKDPIMKSPIRSDTNKKGVSSTLYDPRRCEIDIQAISKFQLNLSKKDKRIGFAHAINLSKSGEKTTTQFGDFMIGSTLSHQLVPLESHIKVISNIKSELQGHYSQHTHIKLPLSFLSEELSPTDWGFITYCDIMFFDTIKTEENECFDIEESTISQSNSSLWFDLRKNRLTSSNAHKIFIRKKNFETLANELIYPNSERKVPKIVKDALKHGKLYESTARENYTQYLKFVLKHDIDVRETGLVIQPNLFWLAASPDGLVSDKSDSRKVGLIEIKCPKTKCNHTPEEMLKDNSFYIHYDNGKLQLKRTHSYGYFTQIQMAMGLSNADFCDFVVFTFKGMIIVRTPFDKDYFKSLVKS